MKTITDEIIAAIRDHAEAMGGGIEDDLSELADDLEIDDRSIEEGIADCFERLQSGADEFTETADWLRDLLDIKKPTHAVDHEKSTAMLIAFLASTEKLYEGEPEKAHVLWFLDDIKKHLGMKVSE